MICGFEHAVTDEIGEFRMIDIDTKLLYSLIIIRDFIMFLFVSVSHMIDYLVRLFGDSGLPDKRARASEYFIIM